MSLYADLDGARARREQIRENSARAATSFVTLRSKGVGDFILDAPVEFDTPFFHRPSVTSGFHLDVRPDTTLYTLPRVTCGVFRWVKTSRGFHTGAYMYMAVDVEKRDGSSLTIEDVENINRTIVVHHVQFNGVSYKPMSGQPTAEVQDSLIVPLTPPAIP